MRLRKYPKRIKYKIITEVKDYNLTFRYINDVLLINNENFAVWISLIYPKELELKERKQQKQLPLPHFVTHTSRLTPMDNFLPHFVKTIFHILIVIY